jgi:Flp pilus assembly protein TadG
MTHGRPRKARQRQRGIALLEFVLTAPLFLILLLGVMEFSYYFYVAVSTTNAAREGARQCTLVDLGGCGNCDPTAAVTYMGKIGMSGFTHASATCAVDGGVPTYTVEVTTDFPTLTGYPVILGAMPSSSTQGNTVVHGVAVMRGQ